jgi:Tol biopolymer transport system component
VLKGNISRKDFWEVDLPTGRERQLTDLGRAFAIGDFDVSPDGGEIVFDSSKEASDIVLIDLQGR